jgi:aspartate-semialdehyde dehydrogenase
MSKTYDVAVVGATGAVGETMLSILAQRKFPVGEVYALASSRSEGKRVEFGDKTLVVQDLDKFDFSSRYDEIHTLKEKIKKPSTKK